MNATYIIRFPELAVLTKKTQNKTKNSNLIQYSTENMSERHDLTKKEMIKSWDVS